MSTTSGWKSATNQLASASSILTPSGNSDAPVLNIAIPFDHSGAWAAQTSFLRSVAISLQRVKHPNARLVLLNLSGDTGAKALASDVRELLVPVERKVWHSREQSNALVKELGIDCVLNLFGPPPQIESAGLVGWIADFQHSRLPQFFLPQELEDRDRIFNDVIQRSHRVMLSSEDAKRDLIRFSPANDTKARVHRFPSGFAFQTLDDSTSGEVCAKYHLPSKFALVANQFWAHKNHLSIIETAAELSAVGHEIPFVLTGLPSDYRDPANSIVSKVLQRISTAGVRHSVMPLGQVPYSDLIALLRHAAVVIQPSSFEGWSTTVQDAKALGRPVACSNIAVHREQAPSAIGFFDPAKPIELAQILVREWDRLEAGPDPEKEAVTLVQERQFADDYGIALWQTCAEAAAQARPSAR